MKIYEGKEGKYKKYYIIQPGMVYVLKCTKCGGWYRTWENVGGRFYAGPTRVKINLPEAVELLRLSVRSVMAAKLEARELLKKEELKKEQASFLKKAIADLPAMEGITVNKAGNVLMGDDNIIFNIFPSDVEHFRTGSFLEWIISELKMRGKM